jgi:hypothetical protein
MSVALCIGTRMTTPETEIPFGLVRSRITSAEGISGVR